MLDKLSLPSPSLNSFLQSQVPNTSLRFPIFLLRMAHVTTTRKTSIERPIPPSLSTKGSNLPLMNHLLRIHNLELEKPLPWNGRNLVAVLLPPDLTLNLNLSLNEKPTPSHRSILLLAQCNEPFRIKPLRLLRLSDPRKPITRTVSTRTKGSLVKE